MAGYFADGEDTHTLRLTSELVDLRVGYAKRGRLRSEGEQKISGTATGHNEAPRSINYKNQTHIEFDHIRRDIEAVITRRS